MKLKPRQFQMPSCQFFRAMFVSLAFYGSGEIRAEGISSDIKPASEHTKSRWQEISQSLPFEDKRDFEEHQKGFIVAPDYRVIKNAEGKVIWDMQSFEFLQKPKAYFSIHPSLQRHALLNMNYGLYRVMDGIYQVRGFDLSNISFIESDSGWIVFDPLTSKETAAAALELVNKHLGKRPVVAVVYSHSHVDHFGGVRGIVDFDDVVNGKVAIIAPAGFMSHAIAENVYAGTAMARRSFLQYGLALPTGPQGHVDQAIGMIKVRVVIEVTRMEKGGFHIHLDDEPRHVEDCLSALNEAQRLARTTAINKASELGSEEVEVDVKVDRIDIPGLAEDVSLVSATITAEIIGNPG